MATQNDFSEDSEQSSYAFINFSDKNRDYGHLDQIYHEETAMSIMVAVSPARREQEVGYCRAIPTRNHLRVIGIAQLPDDGRAYRKAIGGHPPATIIAPMSTRIDQEVLMLIETGAFPAATSNDAFASII